MLFKTKTKNSLAILLLIAGSLIFELTDFIFRVFEVNISNHFNYLISELFLFVLITELYAVYFFKLSRSLRLGLYFLVSIVFIITGIVVGLSESYSVYSNIIINCVLCYFATVYFSGILRKGKVETKALILNVSVYLFFAVDTIVSVTFKFLVSNHLNWVAPIWLFRGVLLLLFYLSLINFGWKTGTNKL